jgi:hypothetical protein
MKQISLRLTPDDWAEIKRHVEKRVGLPMSDNYVARYVLAEGVKFLKVEECNPDARVGDVNLKMPKVRVRRGRI